MRKPAANKPTRTVRLTAYHEAAHVVIAYRLSFSTVEVSIIPDYSALSAGHVIPGERLGLPAEAYGGLHPVRNEHYRDFGQLVLTAREAEVLRDLWAPTKIKVTPQLYLPLEYGPLVRWPRVVAIANIAVSLAGPLAELRVNPRRHPSGTRDDLERAVTMARYTARNHIGAGHLLRRGRAEAEYGLARHWPAVEALAAHLLTWRFLPGSAAQAIIDAAPVNPPPG